MRTKLKITEGIFPMPVLMVATYNEDGSVNVMNTAWGTMQERDSVVLNLTETHKTVQNIKARGAFTVSIADAAHIVEADYFGVESGNKVADKFARSGLTASKAETVDAPVINEFPICLECRFIEYQNNEYGCGVIGKVVNVTADESVMVDGKIDMSKVNAIAFDPYTHGYYKVTERVGEAFRDGLKLKSKVCRKGQAGLSTAGTARSFYRRLARLALLTTLPIRICLFIIVVALHNFVQFLNNTPLTLIVLKHLVYFSFIIACDTIG